MEPVCEYMENGEHQSSRYANVHDHHNKEELSYMPHCKQWHAYIIVVYVYICTHLVELVHHYAHFKRTYPLPGANE